MTHSWEGIVAAIIGLGIMILVHEWGHFAVARLCGVRVEVFSIGFGNRIFGWKRNGTDYRLAVLPFGGYVRMAGENPAEGRTGAPDEFLSQPRWKRLLIILAGPFMNFVLAFVVMWGLYIVGVPVPAYFHEAPQVAGVIPNSTAAKAGLQVGDKIVAINGSKVSNWDQALSSDAIIPGNEFSLSVERAGGVVTLKETVPQTLTTGCDVLGCAKQRAQIDSVMRGDPAAKAGLKPGDVITSIDGEAVTNPDVLTDAVTKSGGKPVTLSVQRDGKDFTATITPTFTDLGDGSGKRWAIGVGYNLLVDTVHESYPFWQAGQQSWQKNYNLSKEIISFVGGLFSGRFSLRDTAGPVGIVKISVQAAKLGMAEFITFMAFLCINLGILNLLPIPILDGGNVLMLAIEGSLRRDLSLAMKERFLTAGLIFLVTVIAFVTYFDILRH
jgi:regulator of sigma E protease